ncbi:hypothetical protein QBC38DRAFT_351956 [Podospora fimiseda]|uniref:Mid2 domain-containing protein n=1 Tax=Podospora fimiseda TaxID=252190 RepID=A0AAN7BZZ1_9PEZI|nr:hypothetical protein QBC38DRAFT_351956 [Podospora fimiseda]
MKTSKIILSLFILAASSVLADPNAPCYFPGGSLAPGYFPCHAFGSEVSSCCAPGWTCFSNSLCIATTESRSWPNISIGAVQRGACTAPKWNNEFCGSVCLTGDGIDGHLAACGNDRYCCSSDFEAGKCTCDKEGAFVISPGLPQTIIQVTDTTFTGSPSISIVTTKPVIRTTSEIDTESMTAFATPGSTDSTLVTSITSSGSGRTASSATSTSEPPPPPGDGNRTLKIALGITIPLVMIILAAVAGWFILKRRREDQHITSGGGREMSGGNTHTNYVNPNFTVHDGLAETHRYAPNRSFGQHYDGVDATGNISTRT